MNRATDLGTLKGCKRRRCGERENSANRGLSLAANASSGSTCRYTSRNWLPSRTLPSDAIIEQGREVGMLARQIFPGGIEVRSEGGLDQAIRATRELVANSRSSGDL